MGDQACSTRLHQHIDARIINDRLGYDERKEIHMRCVLLSGGGGLRLWPLSRKHFPKQFLSLTDGKSMFHKAIERNQPLFSDFMVITNEAYRYMVANELEAMPDVDARCVLESHGRNTAAAIATAALL